MSRDRFGSSPSDARCPDLFILGAPKCGTTTVFDWLRSHPDTYLRYKEPNFLSRDVYDVSALPGAAPDWETYLQRLCPDSAVGKLTGEATPRYLYSDLALQTVAGLGEQVRFLVLLRNPIDLVFSLHGQMVKEGEEPEFAFERAWRRSLAQQDDPGAWVRNGTVDRRLDYPLYGRIGSRLRMALELIGGDRLKVMILEETLSRDPAAAFREITDFIGLRPIQLSELPRSNERYRMRSISLHANLIRIRKKMLWLLRSFGVRPGNGTGLLKAFNNLNRVHGASPQTPDPELRSELAPYFREEVALVEQLLGREIGNWPDFRGVPVRPGVRL